MNALLAAGEKSYNEIAKECRVPRGCVERHHKNHTASHVKGAPSPANLRIKPKKIVSTIDEDEFEEWRKQNNWQARESALRFAERLGFKIHKNIQAAEESGDARLASELLRTNNALLKDFISKVSGLIDERPTTVSYNLQIDSKMASQSLEHLAWLQRWLEYCIASDTQLPEPPKMIKVLQA